jgi:hypothetical protein
VQSAYTVRQLTSTHSLFFFFYWELEGIIFRIARLSLNLF